MTIIRALLVCLVVKVIHAVELDCRNAVTCPCGSSGENFTVCVPDASTYAEVCTRLSKCDSCEEGSNVCLKCLEDLEGAICYQKKSKSRQKRQSTYTTRVYPGSRTVSRQTPSPLTYCRYPGDIANGQVVDIPMLNERNRPFKEGEEEYPEGSALEYSCDDGYVLEGSDVLECQNTGRWSSRPPTCKRDVPTDIMYCDNPGMVSKGKVEYFPPAMNPRSGNGPSRDYDLDEYPEKSVLQYSCDDGYLLQGLRSITCQSTGFWSGEVPSCIPDVPTEIMHCVNPGMVSNVNVQYIPPSTNRRNGNGPRQDYDLDEYPEQSVLQFSCDGGYQLQGRRSITCQSTGRWSGEVPSCVPDCGRSFTQTVHDVINGSKTDFGDWPWVVSISIEEEDGKRIFVCGGALLNSHTVITVAHCLSNPLFEGKTLHLGFGKHNIGMEDDDDELLIRRSSRTIIHPDYSMKTLDSDIGLVIFQPRIRYSVKVQPLCLPTANTTTRNIEPGRVGYVGGWGLMYDAFPQEMMMISLPVVSDKQCEAKYKQHNLVITSNMFCAGYDDATQNICMRGSGLPFVFYDKRKERYTLEGLVSFGVRGDCSVVAKYTIFTKVFRFLFWILKNSK